MKKLAILVGFLMAVVFVSAGSIDNLDYKDKPCIICGDNNRQIDDHNVIIDADTLGGHTADDFVDWSNNLQHQIDNNEGDSIDRDNVLQNQITGNDIESIDRDEYITNIINSNSDKWSEDRGGMTRKMLARYLTGIEIDLFSHKGSYFDWEQSYFVLKSDYDAQIEVIEQRLDYLEATLIKNGLVPADEFETGIMTANRLGKIVKVDGYSCSPTYDTCVKITEATYEVSTSVADVEAEKAAFEKEQEWHKRICERLHVQWHCDAIV